jgi:CTP synthase (UTP-ammonia lyase)
MKPSLVILADFDPNSKSHVATNQAIGHSMADLGIEVEHRWIDTIELSKPAVFDSLGGVSGIWIGPGSPYRNMDGVLAAIRFARERGIPLLGTCGGFQHIILEHARNVLKMPNAEHEESAPTASQLVISKLACSLAGRAMKIQLAPGSKLRRIYGVDEVEEEYLCNFGVNPDYVDTLRSGSLKIVASDAEGAVRAVELPEQRFFIGTLFLPQHRSTARSPHPLVSAFIKELPESRVS